MRVVTVTDSQSSNPVSCDSGWQAQSITNPDNACTPSSSTTYATISLTTGSGAETIVYYSFNFNVPAGATITSVACKAKCYISNRTNANINYRRIRLYGGTSAKGSNYTVGASTSEFDITCGDPSTWSVANVNNAKIRLYAKRGSSNVTTEYHFSFYGATMTVGYTYDETYYEITSQCDVQGVTIGGTTENIAGASAEIIISGPNSGIAIEDNNVDVTSQLVIGSATSAVYTINNLSADHFIYVYTPAGNKIFVKVNGSWVEADGINVKVNGSWQLVDKVYKKTSGGWNLQSDKSDIFDPNALFLKG